MRWSTSILIFSILFLLSDCQYQNQYQNQQQNQNYVTVSCSQGAVQGRTVNLGNDQSQLYSGQAHAFTGIPYCQPPVGNLRFQPPQPINQFNSTLHDATYFRPKCPQLNAGGAPTNEDCLYLNVYTPQVGTSGANLSVLVLIDGSNGFSNGGCDQSQEKGIISNLVQRQIVVVTLQYRIGALGFFTTYTNSVQSNLGMLDQVQAMKWIKTEIVNFGGNPNSITVAGQDDGACAVSAHCLSPMSQNLFNQAIVQSGSVYSCYNPTPAVPTNPSIQVTTPRPMYDQPNTGYGNANYGYQPQTTTPISSYNSANAQYDDPSQQLAETLCNISPDQWNNGQTQNIQNCMKNYTVDFFVNQQPGGPNATWMIVRDTSFLPGSIDSLSSKRPNIPIIIGTVQDEDADYAFKLINTGKGSDPNNLDNWIFDFARKNKLNQTQTNQVQNIINNNYGTGSQGSIGSSQINNQYQGSQGSSQVNNQYQYDQGGQQTNNQYQGSNQQFFGGVVAGQQATYSNQGQYSNQNQYGAPNQNQQSTQNQQYGNQGQQYGGQSQNQQSTQNQQYSNQPSGIQNQYNNQNQQIGQTRQYDQNGQIVYNQNPGQQNQYSNQNQYGNQQYGNQNQQSTQNQYGNQFNGGSQSNNQQQYSQGTASQYSNQYSNQGASQTNNQFQNNGVYTNVTQYSNVNNNYGGGYQRDQSSLQSNGITDYSQLRTISQIASDQSTSLTTTQIQSYMQNGARHVRIYQFTHVSDVGRNTVPNTGSNWKPVFKGQDMFFITMSETIWTNSNYTPQDRQVANQMGQRWSDFVKTGQVANWDTTNQQNYNYCNLNTQTTQQAQYGQQARRVFQDQVNPIVQTAQNNYAMANNQSLPYPSTGSQISRTPGQAQAQYTSGANGSSNFHISFQVNSFPFNG
uniref:COesterase domain-containing protein n=1 Tax=Caenorhabditis tropicalis TaxID=1561998 RepID=A0A1I7U3M7_9PELO